MKPILGQKRILIPIVTPNIFPVPKIVPPILSIVTPNIFPVPKIAQLVPPILSIVTPNIFPVPKIAQLVPPILTKELTLRPWQVEWSKKSKQILSQNTGYIDTSRMGSGKTYIVLWLAKQFNLKLFIICPLIMIDVWTQVASEYNIEISFIINYESLRSVKGCQPKHCFLNRYDNYDQENKHEVSFEPTKEFQKLLSEGILLICDETQRIKNYSDQYKACNALVNAIINSRGKSKFGLLSGTPFEKEKHAGNMLKLLGYIKSDKLYTYDRSTRQIVLKGMQELINRCKHINPTKTQQIIVEVGIEKSQMFLLCYELYKNIIKEKLSGAMEAVGNIEGSFDVGNGFYNISPHKINELQEGISELMRVSGFNEKTNTFNTPKTFSGAITNALLKIERAKTYDMGRVAMSILKADIKNKVIICINYINDKSGLSELIQRLRGYDPLILIGSIKNNERTEVIKNFNNNKDSRVLIMNTAIGGVGISLHDTKGDAPRFMLISPSYKLLDLAQAAGRIYRDGTISDANIRMFYGKDNIENKIIQALGRGTEVLKGTLEDFMQNVLFLPGDYPSFIE